MIKAILRLFGYVPVKEGTYGAIRRILKYSFQDINYNYNWLTKTEKIAVTRKEFQELVNIIKNN